MAPSDTGVSVIPKYTGGWGDYTKQGVRYSQRVLGVYGSAYKRGIYGSAYSVQYSEHKQG